MTTCILRELIACCAQAKVAVAEMKGAKAVASSGDAKSAKAAAATDFVQVSSTAVDLANPPTVTIASTLNPVHVAAMVGPSRGRPALQSSRLFVTDSCSGLSKHLHRKMSNYLAELGMPERPVATRAVCDLVEEIRRNTVTLLSLHSAINKREKAAGSAAGGLGATVKTEKVSKGNREHNKVFCRYIVCLQ